MENYTDEELDIVIENCTAWAEEARQKMRQYEKWGSSWKNSQFYYDELSKLSRWSKRRNQAMKEKERRAITSK